MSTLDLKGTMSESHNCVDCGYDTAPGNPNCEEAEREIAAQVAAGVKKWSIPLNWNAQQEQYFVHDYLWKAAAMDPWGGCLCIACLEKRIGRRLMRDDFMWKHPFNEMVGTARLLERRGHCLDVLGDFPEQKIMAA
jgi:hypothetical protein